MRFAGDTSCLDAISIVAPAALYADRYTALCKLHTVDTTIGATLISPLFALSGRSALETPSDAALKLRLCRMAVTLAPQGSRTTTANGSSIDWLDQPPHLRGLGGSGFAGVSLWPSGGWGAGGAR